MRRSKKTNSLIQPFQASLLADFPASRTPMPEKEKAQQMTAISGRVCLESYKRFNLSGSLQKMFPVLLLGRTEWYSNKCRLTWKLRATKSHRFYFQLAALTHHTDETGYGSSDENFLPTPRATESIERRNWKTIKDKVENGGDTTLTTMLKYQIKTGTQLLPTPRSSEWKGTGPLGSKSQAHRLKKNYLDATIQEIVGQTGHLSPLFVAEMMGLHPDYMVLPFLRGAKDV